jgi:hypothetical protein
MPLIIKVGCSRKVSADYQSRGFTIDLQSEFDPRTLDDTNQLAGAADHLFQLANDLLDEQVRNAGSAENQGPPARGNGSSQPPNRTGNGSSPRRLPNGNGGGNGQPRPEARNGDRSITQAQTRAVNNISRRLEIDADTYATDQFGEPVRNLTLKQGSELIDLLKREIESRSPQGAGR